MFPGFDHAVGDPEEGEIAFDSKEHDIVLVEGLYVLLNQDPWKQLQEVFDKTYFIDTDEEKTAKRLKHRMMTEMKLAAEEADVRIYGNDLVNAKFIKVNLDLSKHQRIRLFAEKPAN